MRPGLELRPITGHQTQRSGDALSSYCYLAQIGPGAYDIHSPPVPSVEEMVAVLNAAVEKRPAGQTWVSRTAA